MACSSAVLWSRAIPEAIRPIYTSTRVCSSITLTRERRSSPALEKSLGANHFVPFNLSVLFPSMTTFHVKLCYSVSYICFVFLSFLRGRLHLENEDGPGFQYGRFHGLPDFFSILAATKKTSVKEANFWGSMVFLGAGLAFLLTTLMVSAQLATPPELIAITSGLMLCVRSLGASSGLAIFNAIFSHGITQNLVAICPFHLHVRLGHQHSRPISPKP